MEAMRQTWTDERMDDLSRRMDAGFARNDADLRSVNARIDARFEGMDARLDAINARFDAMQRTTLQVGGGMIAALLGVMATLVITQA
jgi:division protein CdvB (Snf7/Vps24/ESCRT-III family)